MGTVSAEYIMVCGHFPAEIFIYIVLRAMVLYFQDIHMKATATAHISSGFQTFQNILAMAISCHDNSFSCFFHNEYNGSQVWCCDLFLLTEYLCLDEYRMEELG